MSETRNVMRADLTVEDREGRPIMLVDVKTREITRDDVANLTDRLKAGSPVFPFGMIVDPERIVLVTADGANPDPLRDPIPAMDVLRHYSPNFHGAATPYGNRKFFRYYLTGLVRVWLEDLSTQWGQDEPPKPKALEESGLLQQLQGAFISEEYLIRDDPVR